MHDEHAKANPWKTIVQLQVQLAQTRAELRGSYAGCRQRVSSLQAKLADAYAARDALAHECNQLEADREYNARLVEERDVELTQARAEHAEVLAALVTPELATLLERLAWLAMASHSGYEANKANEFAARIRAALEVIQ